MSSISAFFRPRRGGMLGTIRLRWLRIAPGHVPWRRAACHRLPSTAPPAHPPRSSAAYETRINTRGFLEAAGTEGARTAKDLSSENASDGVCDRIEFFTALGSPLQFVVPPQNLWVVSGSCG